MRQPGGPEVLQMEEIPDPVPSAGEVLVRVRACALNHLDLWTRRGGGMALPHILGSDAAGEVAQLGPGVSGWETGTRVMVQPGLSCGRCRACLTGRDNYCPEYGILGRRQWGGYAELLRVPAANLVRLPDELDFAAAAAVPLTFTTAWEMVVQKGQVRPGQEVLVVAAGSGVGTAAIQIARLFGARVLTTAGGAAKAKRALALGADAVIDYTREPIAGAVKRLTGGRGVDLVIEHVGQAVWNECISSLARGGRLVNCGDTTGSDGHLDIANLFFRQIAVIGSFMGSKGHLLAMLPHLQAGRLRPVVDRVLPLAEAAAAHAILERREQFGKVVLAIG